MEHFQIEEVIERVLRDHNGSASDPYSLQLTSNFDDLGFPAFLAPVAAGGLGGDWSSAYRIFVALGRWGTPIILGEEMLASWLLGKAGLEVRARVGLCFQADMDLHRDGTCSGWARNVPIQQGVTRAFLAQAGQGDRKSLVHIPLDATKSQIHRENLAGEIRVDFFIDRASPVSVSNIDAEELDIMDWGALLRTCQMAGAFQRILSLVVDHVKTRKQFGRELASFQVVQHQVATLCSEAAAVGCAAEVICRGAPDHVTRLDIACAKLRANMAVEAATAISHQMHGAIGFTKEHSLHQYTRRLWAWRSECGNDRHWSKIIGEIAASAGAPRFWELLTATSDANIGRPE